MLRRHIEVTNKLGLHARAAAKLVNEASSFESTIKLRNDDREIDATSIMGVMMLAASKGTQLELRVDGADEQFAMDAIVELFESGFGEEE
jgi:phosphocarrier protein